MNSSLFSASYEIVARGRSENEWDVIQTICITGPEAYSDAKHALSALRRELPLRALRLREVRTERRFLDE